MSSTGRPASVLRRLSRVWGQVPSTCGIVRSPHHAVETDIVAGIGLGPGHEARPDEAVPLPVLGRRELEHGAALRAQVAVEGAVEVAESAGDPVGEKLRERELQAGMAVEHAGPHEPPQVPGAEEERLGEREKNVGDVPERVVLGRDRVHAVGVERHVVLLAHRPQRLVDLVVEARVLARGGHSGEGDAAPQAVLSGPLDLSSRPSPRPRSRSGRSRRTGPGRRSRSRPASGCRCGHRLLAARSRAPEVPVAPARGTRG